MDLGTVRSKFIQTQLRRALVADDKSLTWQTALEFRRYFNWFANSITEPDRELISYQLRLLEDSCTHNREQIRIESTLR